jgi:galactose-1-phosphate uridylyltransferase
MTIEYEVRNGNLVWIKSPVTGVVSYVVDLSSKSFAFTLGARGGTGASGDTRKALTAERIAEVTSSCPFCPGNEKLAPHELLRVSGGEDPANSTPPWMIRAFNNLFPRIPDELTGDRNESYVVVEDPRHFLEHPKSIDDLMYSGALEQEQFFRLLEVDCEVMRHSLSNPAVHSVVIRKNQGRESGASQPHSHQQLIGSPSELPSIEAEIAAQDRNPGFWLELIALVKQFGLILDEDDGVVSYASPVGVFPRSYDVIIPNFRGLLTELPKPTLRSFARALHQILRILGPLPLDYEIHQTPELPLHAHVNARLFPYSNVAGTLNLPSMLFRNTAAARQMLKSS